MSTPEHRQILVTVNFGDGTWTDYETESDDPETAAREARDYILDNVFIQVRDADTDELLEEAHLWTR